MKRSMYAGRVCEEHIGQEMTWKDGLAVSGGLIFIDLQIVNHAVKLSTPEKFLQRLWQQLKVCSEFVIEVTGQVAAREQANDKLPTGAAEENATVMLNAAKVSSLRLKMRTGKWRYTFKAGPLPWPFSSSRDVGKSQTSCQGDPFYP